MLEKFSMYLISKIHCTKSIYLCGMSSLVLNYSNILFLLLFHVLNVFIFKSAHCALCTVYLLLTNDHALPPPFPLPNHVTVNTTSYNMV